MSAVPHPPKRPQQGQAAQLTDVKTLRENARRHIEEGAVTESYGANKEKVLQLLQGALATELVCVLRYRHDHFVARGFASKAAADEFLEHANEELQHADQLAERIAIDSYREMIQYIGDSDPTTRRMLEEILATEEEHADDLADLLQDAGPARN